MFKDRDNASYDKMGDLNTLIGKGSVIEGNLTSEHSLRIDGKLIGNIKSTDSIIIGKDGHVQGEIDVKNVILGGSIKGKIVASGKITLESTAVFVGQLKAAKLVIAEGATFDGSSHMKGASEVISSRSEQEGPKVKPVEVPVETSAG